MRKYIKIISLLCLLSVLLISFGCGYAGEPMSDDMYTKNVYPGYTDKYSIGSDRYSYDESHINTGYFDDIEVANDATIGNELTVAGTADIASVTEYWSEYDPELNEVEIVNNGVPTIRTVGIEKGYSLPIWDAGPNYAERLFYNIKVPADWDGNSDIMIHVACMLDNANANKKFQLRLEWWHYTPGVDRVTAGDYDVDVETTTGGADPQYQSHNVIFRINYDQNPAGAIEAGDILVIRFSRIAATADEIAGEVVINNMAVYFQCDKFGSVVE